MNGPDTALGTNLLLTGVNGFLGRALLLKALSTGHTCRTLSRGFVSGVPPDYQFLLKDPVKLNAVRPALQQVDTVIHCAALAHQIKKSDQQENAQYYKVNYQFPLHLAEMASSYGVKRFVFISSAGVGGIRTHISHYLSEVDVSDDLELYARSKLLAEQSLSDLAKRSNLEVVILRPCLSYGPHAKGNFARLLNLVSSGLPLPLANVHNLRSYVYVGNLVDAILRAATHPAAANQTFMVSDQHDISTPDLIRQLASGMGKQAHLFGVPQSMLAAILRVAGKLEPYEKLVGSLRVDSSKISHMLGWVPPYTLHYALQKTAQQYLTRVSGR